MANEARVIARVADLLTTEQENRTVPFCESRISAGTGFPSPAENYSEKEIDLHAHMVHDRDATFIMEAVGDSMEKIGIFEKTLLVVDRSKEAKSGCIVIAVVENEFRTKFYQDLNGDMWLVPANESYKPLLIDESHGFYVWGVVTWFANNAINFMQLCSLLSMGTTSTSAATGFSDRIWRVSR